MAIKIRASKEERNRAKDYIKAHLPQYLERIGINPERNFKCLSPEHDDTHGDMSYHRPSSSCACHCGARFDTFDLIGIEYGLNTFSEKFQKGCEIFGLLGQEESDDSLKVPENWRELEPVRNEVPDRAEDGVCSKVYMALSRCESTKLREEHKADLLKRGFTEDDIKRFRFCSMPKNTRKAASEVVDKVGFILNKVPGFFLENLWDMVKEDGYLCPAWDGERNQISGFQIRRNKAPKYIWLSSAKKPMGASSGAVPTILPGKDTSIWIVTEGILKALAVYCLLGKEVSVIGVPGVGTIGGFKSFMDEKQGLPITFIEAYDMDKAEDNKAVKDAQRKLLGEISKRGFNCHSLTWDMGKSGKWQHKFKGLDDFLCDYVKTEGNREKFIKYLNKVKAELASPTRKIA